MSEPGAMARRSRSSPRRAAPGRPPLPGRSTTCCAARRVGARRGSRPAGQPVRLLRRAGRRRPDHRRRAERARQGDGRDPRRRAARQPWAGRGGAGAERQDGPRDDAAPCPARARPPLRRDTRGLPPSLGLLTVNALVAADHALISSEAEYFSLQGVEQALEVVELAKESLHPDLDWLGVVLNIADLRTIHAREAHKQLASASARRSSTPWSAVRWPTRSRPNGASRSSTTAPTSAPTTWRWPPRWSSAWAGASEGARVAALRQELVPA